MVALAGDIDLSKKLSQISRASALSTGLLVFLAFCVNQQVDGAGLAEKAPLEIAWKIDKPLALPILDTPSSLVLNVPAIPRRQGMRRCIRIAVHLYTPRPAGWNHYLALRLNGEPIRPRSPAGRRLLNRLPYFKSTLSSEPTVPYWRMRSGLPCLETFFVPNVDKMDPRVTTDTAEGCWYLLDVDDLRWEKPGRLEIINTALASYWPKGPGETKMVVEVLEIGYLPESSLAELARSKKLRRTRIRGVSFGGTTFVATLARRAGLQVILGDTFWWFESSFSYVRDGKIAWASLDATNANGGAVEWKRKANEQTWTCEIKTPQYTIERVVKNEQHRIKVLDTIHSTAKQNIGVLVRHRLIAQKGIEEARLGGLPESLRADWRNAANPTVFLTQHGLSMGFLAEDDATRLQMASNVLSNYAIVEVNHFGLKPGGSYTFEYDLYPLASGDYFQFVNAVRRDWKVNFTIQGPFDFVSAKEWADEKNLPKLKQELKRKPIKIFALTPWFEYYHYWNMPRSEYKALYQKAMRNIRKAAPGALCIACVETNLVPVPLSFFKGTLPKPLPYGRPGHKYRNGCVPPGKYGLVLSRKATAIVDQSPWRDSVLRTEDGRAIVDTWYVHNYGGDALNLIVYPAVGNYRFRHGKEQLEWLLDKVGFDGLYIDQFSLAYGTADRFSYDKWDGHTVDIDRSTGRITKKYTDAAWAGAEARRRWLKLVFDRGKIVVANSEPAVRETQSLPAFRFMETQGYDVLGPGVPDQPRLAKGQLASPIGLGHQWYYKGQRPGARFFIRTVIAHLKYGLLYYYYATTFPRTGDKGGEYGPVSHMYPFTPIELHKGWMLGKERLITCISGVFPIPWKKAVLWHFDDRGRTKGAPVHVAGPRVPVALRDWNEIAVIERVENK